MSIIIAIARVTIAIMRWKNSHFVNFDFCSGKLTCPLAKVLFECLFYQRVYSRGRRESIY